MSNTSTYIVIGVSTVVILCLLCVFGVWCIWSPSKDSLEVYRGANNNEEEVALNYYRTMVCMKCPDDSYQPLWRRYSGRHCAGRLALPLVVLHSDGDNTIEDIFRQALVGVNVISRIVRGRPPSWVHDTPSVWCFGGDSLYLYTGEMCVEGIHNFAKSKYAAQWKM